MMHAFGTNQAHVCQTARISEVYKGMLSLLIKKE